MVAVSTAADCGPMSSHIDTDFYHIPKYGIVVQQNKCNTRADESVDLHHQSTLPSGFAKQRLKLLLTPLIVILEFMCVRVQLEVQGNGDRLADGERFGNNTYVIAFTAACALSTRDSLQLYFTLHFCSPSPIP